MRSLIFNFTCLNVILLVIFNGLELFTRRYYLCSFRELSVFNEGEKMYKGKLMINVRITSEKLGGE